MFRRLSMATCAAAMAAHAGAAELRGVWAGTMGEAPIIACFEDATAGEYYYIAHRTSIPLSRDDEAVDWKEGGEESWRKRDDEISGRWSGFQGGERALAASWHDPAGKRSLPIRLERIADLATDASCYESDAFNAPRRAATPTRLGEPAVATIDNRLIDVPGVPGPRVRILAALPNERDASLKVLQLEDRDTGAQAINAQLRAGLDAAIDERYECRNWGVQGERDHEADSLAYADPRWLTVRVVDRWDCGGAHPDAGIELTTYDRQTGAPFDPRSWIVAPGDDYELPAALAELLGTKAVQQRGDPEHPDSECAEVYAGWTSYQVWPAPGGLAFAPTFPHAGQACIEDVFVPITELEPFLSDEGRAALGIGAAQAH